MLGWLARQPSGLSRGASASATAAHPSSEKPSPATEGNRKHQASANSTGCGQAGRQAGPITASAPARLSDLMAGLKTHSPVALAAGASKHRATAFALPSPCQGAAMHAGSDLANGTWEAKHGLGARSAHAQLYPPVSIPCSTCDPVAPVVTPVVPHEFRMCSRYTQTLADHSQPPTMGHIP